MKFLHAMIRIKNLKNSLKFYQDFLGLKLYRELRLEDCSLYFLKDENTGVDIELTLNDDIPENGYRNGDAFGHFAFEVDNMAEIAEKVGEFGYNWMYEPFFMGEAGSKIAFIKDPDGNAVELIEKH